jgi:DNA-binding transcriptional LysR family regulator
MAWGHLPRFMIDAELRDGRLLPVAGRHFPGAVEELSAVRRRDRPHGPVTDQLWDWGKSVRAAVGLPVLARGPSVVAACP